ncbi:MAG: hypothetical protein IK088_07805 [Lachnospiraceae bacterium]|nr:hypothetical protein [Lachnospiraceae bacterium]
MYNGRDDLQYGVVACVNGMSGVETDMMLPQPVHQFEDGRCRGCDALDPDFVFPYTVTSLSTDKTVVDSLEPFRIELQLDHALTLHEYESVGANVEIYDETDNWIDNCWLRWDGSRTFSTTYSFDPDRQLPAGTYTIQVEEIYQDFSDNETGGYRRILLVRASDAPTATIDYNGYESVLDVQFAPVSLPETLHCFDQIYVALTVSGVPVSGVSASFTLYYSDDEDHWVNGSWVETDENGRMYISIYPWQNHMDDHYRLNVNCDAFHINEWYDLPALAHSYENGVCTGCGAIDPDFDDYPFEITSFTMNKTSVDSNEPVNFTLSLDGTPLDENGLAYWHAAIHVKDPDGNEIDSFELNDRNGNQVTGSYLFPKTNFWEAGTYTFTVNSVTRNDNWPEIPLAKPSDAPVLSIQYNGYDHVAEALLQFDPLGEEIHCGDSIHARLTVNGEPVKDKYVEFTVYYTGGSSSVLVDASTSNTNANGYATIPFRIYENHEDDAYVVYAREYTMNLYANMTLPTASHAFENGFCTYCGEIGPDYEYPYEVQYFTIDKKTTVATNELIAAEVKLKNCSKWIEVRMALLDEAGNTIDEYYSYGDGRSMKTFSITTGYGLPAGTYTLELRSVMMYVYDETLQEYHSAPAADPGSVPSLTITYLGPDSSVEYAMYLTSPNPDGSIRCGDEVTAVVTSDGASVANADVQFTFGVNGESYDWRNVTTDANGLARTTFSLSDDAGSYYVLARLQDTDVSASIYFSAASHDYESGVCMNCDRYDPDFDDYPFEVSSFSLRHTELKDREILPLDFVLTKLKNESYSNLWINAYITTNGYSRDLYLMIDDTTGRVTADFLLNSEEMPAGTYYLFLNGISMNKYVNGRYMSLRAADLNDISPLAFTFLGEGAAVSYSASIVSEEPLVCGTWAEVQILADGAPLAYAPVYVDSYCGEERITWNSLVVTDENGIARAFIRADWEDSAGASDYSLRISIADETIGTIPCAIAHDFHEGICSCSCLDPDYHDHPFTVTGFSLNRTAIAFGEPLTAEIRIQGDKDYYYMSAMFMIRDSEGIKSELWANCDVLNRICLTVPTSTIAQLTPGTYSLSVEQITYEYTDDATGEYRRAAAADVSGLAPIEFTYLGEEGTHFELHLNVETDDRVADCGEELTATLTSNGMPVSNAELEIWFLITDGNQENNYCYRSFFRTTDGDGRVTFPMELEDRRYMLEEGQKIAVWASFGTLIAKLEFDDFAHDGTDVCAQCGYPVHEVETRVYTVDLLEIDKETVYQGDVVTAHIKISSPNGDPVSDLRLNVYGNNEYYYLSSGAQYLDENGEVTVKIPVTCNYEEGYNVFTVVVSLYDYKYPATIRSCPEVTFTQLEGEIVLPTLHGTLTLTPDVIGEGEPITYTAVVLDESNVPYENAIVRFETWFGSRSIGASNVPTNEEGIAEMSIRLYEDGWAPYGEYTIKAVVSGTVIDTKTVMFTGYTNGVSVDEAGLVDVPETMYDDSEEGFLVIDASFLPDKAEGVRFTRAELSAILTSIRTSGKRLGIRLSDAAIALDDAAVEELLSAPGNDDIEIRCYRIPVYELNAAEQADLSDSLRYVPMHLSARTGSEAITGLSEGTMEVFLPFLPEESTDICTLRLFGRSSEGLTERTEKLTFADDLLRFTTDLFADFVFSVNWNLLYADTDSDDLVTVDDAAYLLYSLYFPDAYPRNQSFDFNGDNVEDEQDALYLLYALVFPDLYPLRKE